MAIAAASLARWQTSAHFGTPFASSRRMTVDAIDSANPIALLIADIFEYLHNFGFT